MIARLLYLYDTVKTLNAWVLSPVVVLRAGCG